MSVEPNNAVHNVTSAAKSRQTKLRKWNTTFASPGVFRQGLSLLLTALCIAIAALSAVAFFADRVEQALYQQGASALAADIVVQQSEPIPAAWITAATEQGLQHSQSIGFPSVIFANGKPQLVQVKAVDAAYPLRGQLQLGQSESSAPPITGTAYADPALYRTLNLQPQDNSSIPFGKNTLTLQGQIIATPDASANLFQLAPRLLVNRQDAETSELLGPASRAQYQLLLAGEPTQIQAYRTWLSTRLPDTSEILTFENNSPALKNAIQRAKRFLSLAALCASLLAGVGILLASRHYVQSLRDQTAILRTLGMTGRQVVWHHARPLGWATLIGTSLGIIIGYGLQQGFAYWLASAFAETLPAASWRPIPIALIHASILVSGFALPSLWAIQQITPLQVLRQAPQPIRYSQSLAWSCAGLAFCGLLYWQADDIKLAFGIAGGLIAMIIIFGGASALLLAGIRRYRTNTANPYSGLAALQREPGLTRIQIVGYGLSLSLLLLLVLVRVDILQAWQTSLPANTPNHFLINIQPNQVTALQTQLDAPGIQDTGYYPTTRARLIAINAQAVEPEAYRTPRAKQLANREYSLGFGDILQADNQITAGTWWPAGTTAVSVEQEVAEQLGIQVGDTLHFNVAGETISAPVANIRRVSWESFNINFFIQASANLAAQAPHSYITSLYIPDTQHTILADLATDYPAVSAINIQPLLDKVTEVIRQGILAIEGVFLFTLAAAGLVSLAAIQISRAQRQRDIALLRVIGATRRRIRQTVISEFALLGGLAGILAAALANSLGIILGTWLFDLTIGLNPWLWLLGIGGGIIGVSLLGWLASRPILRSAPMAMLR